MREFPSSQADLFNSPFLPEPDWSVFTRRVEQLFALIREGEAVLCAEKDPIQSLAVIFATVLKHGGVFQGNPAWQDSEWKQFDHLTGVNRVFGECSIRVDGERAPAFDEARIMIPSGGTSGGLRFCVHSLATLSSAVESLFRFHGSKPLNSVGPLGLFHVSGLMPVLRACLTGGCAKMIDWKALEQGDYPRNLGELCSISLVPTQLGRLIKTERGLRFLHGFGIIYLGGASPSPDLVNRIRTEKLPVLFVYGMTETAAMVVVGSRGDSDSLGNVWGRPLPGVSVSLTGEDEIVLQTESLFRGYFPNDVFIDTFSTGDLGRWTLDEQLQVLGRKNIVINTGGEKVNPEEIESILMECLPGVSLAVGSQSDPDWGQQVVAVFESEIEQTTIDRVRQWLDSRLAPHKIPKAFIYGIPIPRTVLGKVKRTELQAILLER